MKRRIRTTVFCSDGVRVSCNRVFVLRFPAFGYVWVFLSLSLLFSPISTQWFDIWRWYRVWIWFVRVSLSVNSCLVSRLSYIYVCSLGTNRWFTWTFISNFVFRWNWQRVVQSKFNKKKLINFSAPYLTDLRYFLN